MSKPRFICIKCGKHTFKTKCPTCKTKTTKCLDKCWNQTVGTKFRYDDLKYGIDDYPERESLIRLFYNKQEGLK